MGFEYKTEGKMADFSAATAAAAAATSAAMDSRLQAGSPSLLHPQSPTPTAAVVPVGIANAMPVQLATPPDISLTGTATQMELCSKSSPTAEEMKDWVTILHASRWAGFTEKRAAVLTSLMEHLDMDVDDELRVFGRTNEARYLKDLQDWEVNGRAAKSSHITLAEGLLHAARVFVGADKSWQEHFQEEKCQQWIENQTNWNAAHQPVIHQVMGAPAPAPDVQQYTQTCLISDIADPYRTDRIRVLNDAEVSACIDTWKRLNGSEARPAAKIMPSPEQLGVGLMYKVTNQVPYFSMCLTGPHHQRHVCAMLRVGLTFAPDGSLVRGQFKGPPSIEHFNACQDVIAAIFEMHDMIDPAILRDYSKFINALHTRYGRACWAQIYQAHCRVWKEEILNIKRNCIDLLQEVARLESEGKRYYGMLDPNKFDPARPWNHSLRMAIDKLHSLEFWEEHVHSPCGQIQSRIAYANQFLDGDCCIAAENEPHYPTGFVPQITSGIYDHNDAQRTPPLKTKVKKEHLKADPNKGKGANRTRYGNNSGGVVNKKAVTICPAYQHGGCQSVKGQCPRGFSHQCTTCFQQGHGANSTSCPGAFQRPVAPPNPTPLKGDKGGKGGKKGKGKKGFKGKN